MFLKIKISVKSSLWTKNIKILETRSGYFIKPRSDWALQDWTSQPWEPTVQKTVADSKHLIIGERSKVTTFVFVASYLWGAKFETTKISCYQSSATALESGWLKISYRSIIPSTFSGWNSVSSFSSHSVIIYFSMNIWNMFTYTVTLEEAMAPHSSTLAWKILWTEEPGRLQSMGSLRVGHDWATSLWLFTFMHQRRKWQPTPVFLPGESQGWGSLVGCHLWGRTESDTTEVT